MTDYHVRTDCRLCAGPIETVLDLGETALANELKATAEESRAQDRFPLFLSQCKSCGHVQLPVVVKPERLFPPDYPYKSGTNPVFRAHLREFARTVSGMLPPCSTVLEIASNDGTLLRELRQYGLDAEGVDPAAGESKFEWRGFFSKDWADQFTPTEHGRYDAIVALNVFAHVDDLNDFTAGVAALLPEDGLFVFEVGYLPDVIAKGLYRVAYHEHGSMHHLAPLVPFFKKHGLALDDAHRVDTQGGSIRGYVRKRAGGDMSARLHGLLAAETSEALRVGRLRDAILRDWSAIRNKLGSVKSTGGRIAGYGAPAQLTTTMHALGLTASDIDFIADDNPLKQGRFTPGTGVPILPTAALLERNPEACVIFSANFSEEIKARNADYRGEWIVIGDAS